MQGVGICKELLSKLQELCFDRSEYDTAPLLKQALDAQGKHKALESHRRMH